MYRNYAVTIARTGDDIVFLRDDGALYALTIVLRSDAGCLDATCLIATGSVRKSASGDYTVADYVRRAGA